MNTNGCGCVYWDYGIVVPNPIDLNARVAHLEAELRALRACSLKPATGVVKAPGRPVYGDGDWRKGVEWEAKRWRAALAEAGIKVEDAE